MQNIVQMDVVEISFSLYPQLLVCNSSHQIGLIKIFMTSIMFNHDQINYILYYSLIFKIFRFLIKKYNLLSHLLTIHFSRKRIASISIFHDYLPAVSKILHINKFINIRTEKSSTVNINDANIIKHDQSVGIFYWRCGTFLTTDHPNLQSYIAGHLIKIARLSVLSCGQQWAQSGPPESHLSAKSLIKSSPVRSTNAPMRSLNISILYPFVTKCDQ